MSISTANRNPLLLAIAQNHLNIMQKRVTWIIPVKNGMPYLPETLSSIEAQTYKNWQVLVWDNGSTDGTVEELNKWIPSRLPGRVITGQPLSVGASLARMVELCDTELCARIDADDINLPERLEKQIAFLDAHRDVAIVGSQMYRMNAAGVVQGRCYLAPFQHDDIVHFLLKDTTLNHPSVVFRRTAVLEVGNYRDFPNIEDYDLWLRMAYHHKLANLDVPLINFRIHSRSTTEIARNENKLTNLANECFIKNAPLLYGCSETEAKLLRENRHPLPLLAVLKIAKYLQDTQGGHWWERFRSKSFIAGTKRLISSKDIISRIIWAALWYYRKQN